MDDYNAITIIPDSQVSLVQPTRTDLERSGEVANYYAEQTAFTRYHEKRSSNTKDRQVYDLKVFCQYLASIGVEREAQRLYNNPEEWRGMEPGHVEGFVEWQRLRGFAVGSIKVRLSTVRKYCALAFQAGVIPSDTHARIRTIQGYTYSEGINIDESRKEQGIATRQGRKKAEPTSITRQQVRRLKIASIDGSKRSRRRAHDANLDVRDSLLVHLLCEHGFRCSEVVGLDIEHFNLQERKVKLWRSKTKKWYIYDLVPSTYEALLTYLATQNRASGPLFMGYGGKRVHRNTVNARIQELGKALGFKVEEVSSQGSPLSPHDLRNRWTFDVIQAGNPLDQAQYYGGWNSPAMLLLYAKKAGIAYGPLKLPE